DARDLRGEGVELVHHGIDGVLQLKDLAFDVHRDLFTQVAVGHGGGHLGDVAHLGGQVAGHRVDAVRQLLPNAGHTADQRLAPQPAFGTDLAGDAGHFGGEGV